MEGVNSREARRKIKKQGAVRQVRVSESSKSPNQVQSARSVPRARQRPQESPGFTLETTLEKRPLCPPASNQSSKDQPPSVDTAAAG